MKKIIYIITIALVMIILFSGCVNKENEQSLVYDQTLLEIRENKESYDFYSAKRVDGFEFLLKGDVEEGIIQNDDFLTMVKKQGGSTYLAIAGIGEPIESGEWLFSLPKEQVIFQQSKAVNSSEVSNNLTRESTATQQLLGDFNADNIVDIFDFVEFVQHCPSQEGEEAYGEQYDIGPATDTNEDGIYDTKYADGFVDIFDFVVLSFNYGKSVPLDEVPEMVLVNGGIFQMGNTRDNSEESDLETPVHTVDLTYDYYIGKYELTNAQFLKFLNDAMFFSDRQLNGHPIINIVTEDCEFEISCEGFNLKQAGKAYYPVIYVTWWGAMEYCNWLSDKEGLACAYDNEGNLLDTNGQITTDITQVEGYRLPTEAEWEYAARGGHEDITNGNEANDYKYSGSNDIDEVGWYEDNSENSEYPKWKGKGTHEVGQKASNELGLYDMSGNVREWCHDYWDSNYYDESLRENPVNLESSSGRVLRGGTWINSAIICGVSYRNGYHSPDDSRSSTGFRIARTHEPNPPQTIYSLTIDASPTEGGNVSFDGITWTDNANQTVEVGTEVDIQAKVNEGYRFFNWTKDGVVVSTQLNHTYMMTNENVNLVANFEADVPVEPIISITFDPGPEPGNRLPDTFDIVLIATHPESELAYLKASLNFEDSEEFFWSEEATSNGAEQLDVRKAQLHVDLGESTERNMILQILVRDVDGNIYTKEAIYTVYKKSNEYTITIEASPKEGGVVSFDGNKWAESISKSIETGNEIDIYAQATDEYTFEGWYEGSQLLSTDKSYVFVVDHSMTIEARFDTPPEVEWFVDHSQEMRDIIESTDGYFYVGGINANSNKIYKINSSGEVVWSIGGSLYALIEGENGDILSAGNGYWDSSTRWDYKFMNFDSYGNVLLSKNYGGVNDETAHSLDETSDGGVILAGFSYSEHIYVSEHGRDDIWIVKLDSDYKVEWERYLGGGWRENTYSIRQTNDGGYIIAGWTDSSNGDLEGHERKGYDFWVIKLDNLGNIDWHRTLGGNKNEKAYSLDLAFDGGYIIAGSSNSNDGDVSGNHGTSSDYWIVKLDSYGTIEWQKCLGGSNLDEAYSVITTHDGNYLVAGASRSRDGDVGEDHGNNYDYWIVKLNSIGEIIWEKSLGDAEDNKAYAIKETSDGGIVVTGDSGTYKLK